MVTAKQKQGAQAYRKGYWAEVLCAVYLIVKGYHIVERRHKTRLGEIDLIARQGNNLIFVEVKARPTLVKAGEAVSESQKVRLRRAATAYLAGRAALSSSAQRFDVMLVLPWRLPLHYINAF